MTRNPRAARAVRGRLAAPFGATALALVVLAMTATTVAAGSAVEASVDAGTLRITGSPSPDRIALRLSAADSNQLQVDVGDDGTADFSFDRGTFAAIDVRAGNGADTVRIDQVNGIFTTTEATRIDGQNGDDSLHGGTGAEVFVGGRGDDVVDGNAGADTAFLGSGDDTFVWDQGDGSDVVEGASGSDTLVFNGFGANENMAAAPSGGRVRFTRVQGGIVMDLDDVEAIDVTAPRRDRHRDRQRCNRDGSGPSRRRPGRDNRRFDRRRPGRHGQRHRHDRRRFDRRKCSRLSRRGQRPGAHWCGSPMRTLPWTRWSSTASPATTTSRSTRRLPR